MKALFIRLYINQELLLRVDPNRCDGLILLLFSRLFDLSCIGLCLLGLFPQVIGYILLSRGVIVIIIGCNTCVL